MAPPTEVVHICRVAFENGRTKCLRFRENQLRKLLQLYKENRAEIEDVLKKDLKRRQLGNATHEIDQLIKDLKSVITQFKDWACVENLEEASRFGVRAKTKVFKEPRGVVLIISAYCHPLNLCLKPLASAIASGNCVVLKPSHITPHISELISELLPRYLNNECYHVLIGGVTLIEELANENFDYILYSGPVNLGNSLKTLCERIQKPIRLRFVGKSPVYLDDSSDLRFATQSIFYGKFESSTCDYVLCPRRLQNDFFKFACDEIKLYRGKTQPEAHFWRLKHVLSRSKPALGGKSSVRRLCIEPTLLLNIQPQDLIMKEEIFGSILPVLSVDTLESALRYLHLWEKPNVLHIFSTDRETVDFLLENANYSAACVNNIMVPLQASKKAINVLQAESEVVFDDFITKKRVSHRYYRNMLWWLYPLIKLAMLRKRTLDLLVVLRYTSFLAVGIFTALLSRYFFGNFDDGSLSDYNNK